MKELLILDVEATGTEEEDRLIQVAYRHSTEFYDELFKPPVPIKLPAMAVHHITEDMVKDKQTFTDSQMFRDLSQLSESHVLVAHNAPYDLKMLEKEGITFPTFVDTLKVVRHIDRGQFEAHNLQYLRYYYNIDLAQIAKDQGVTREISAHDALADILVLSSVNMNLIIELMEMEDIGLDDALERAIEISQLPSKIQKFSFGKYRGETVDSVALRDSGYLEWLLNQKRQNPEGEEDWIYTLESALN